MSEKYILFTLKGSISLYIFYYFETEVPNTKWKHFPRKCRKLRFFKEWKLIFLQNQYSSKYFKSPVANKKAGKGISAQEGVDKGFVIF